MLNLPSALQPKYCSNIAEKRKNNNSNSSVRLARLAVCTLLLSRCSGQDADSIDSFKKPSLRGVRYLSNFDDPSTLSEINSGADQDLTYDQICENNPDRVWCRSTPTTIEELTPSFPNGFINESVEQALNNVDAAVMQTVYKLLTNLHDPVARSLIADTIKAIGNPVLEDAVKSVFNSISENSDDIESFIHNSSKKLNLRNITYSVPISVALFAVVTSVAVYMAYMVTMLSRIFPKIKEVIDNPKLLASRVAHGFVDKAIIRDYKKVLTAANGHIVRPQKNIELSTLTQVADAVNRVLGRTFTSYVNKMTSFDNSFAVGDATFTMDANDQSRIDHLIEEILTILSNVVPFEAQYTCTKNARNSFEGFKPLLSSIYARLNTRERESFDERIVFSFLIDFVGEIRAEFNSNPNLGSSLLDILNLLENKLDSEMIAAGVNNFSRNAVGTFANYFVR